MEKRKYTLDRFEPAGIMKHFEDICSFPHGSGNEAKLGTHIENFAKAQGLTVIRDETGNLLVRVPASNGCENTAPVLIQGHMDMVCVKKDGATIDMENEPVKLKVEDGILYADGTTLGADNAVALCIMMKLMENEEPEHPPLELLFTVEEETGMHGILNFDMKRLHARRMITMDCGDPDKMVTGSAGINKFTLSRSFAEIPFCGAAFTIEIGGLKGGHSGGCIGMNQGSALDFAGRVLYAVTKELAVQLVSISTPYSSTTAIPRQADLTIGIQNADEYKLRNIISTIDMDFRNEVNGIEPNYNMIISGSSADSALPIEDTKALTNFLLLVPYDTFRRSMDGENKPRSSAMLTRVDCSNGIFSACFCARANLDAYMNATIARLEALCSAAGIQIAAYSRIPAWPRKEASQLRTLCRKVYTEEYGEPMRETMIHGAVEASVISGAIPDMDIVGFAPLARGAHTVEERLYLNTMPLFWTYLKKVLSAMCRTDDYIYVGPPHLA